MIDACDELHVLCLEGWQKSNGIKGEIKRAVLRGMKVRYIDLHPRLAFCGSRSLTCKKTRELISEEIEFVELQCR